MPVRILGREPAAWVAFFTILVQGIGAFWADFTVSTQAIVIACLTAGLNVVVAFVVHDGVIAAVGGFIQSAVVLAVGLGAHLSDLQQTLLVVGVVGVLQFFTRQNVTAPVPAGVLVKPVSPTGV
jgi:hypothetical protein